MPTKPTPVQRTQIWHPDTCECKCEIDWIDDFDDSTPMELVGFRKLAGCTLHDHLNGKAHYEAVVAHNRAENAKKAN